MGDRHGMVMVERNAVLEVEPHKFVTEASDLGLPVGEWPARLETNIGNGQDFVRTRSRRDREGDVLAVVYRQELGCVELHVLND